MNTGIGDVANLAWKLAANTMVGILRRTISSDTAHVRTQAIERRTCGFLMVRPRWMSWKKM